MKDLQKLMDDISKWSNGQFGEGQRNPAIVHHLVKEVPELIEAIEKFQLKESYENTQRVGFEFADCFMLLLDSASHFGLTAGNLLYYTEQKLEINKKRKWGKPDENGVVEHIKE
jgi:NTP pyrophosphatase (non-canonical NTP hydrolase)